MPVKVKFNDEDKQFFDDLEVGALDFTVTLVEAEPTLPSENTPSSTPAQKEQSK